MLNTRTESLHDNLLAGLALVAAIAFTAPAAQAADDHIDANVRVATPIAITGEDDLVFGIITAPTAGTATWQLNPDTEILTQTSATDSISLGGAEAGRFGVTGDSNVQYDISVTSTDFTAAGLSLTNVTTTPSAGTGTGFLNAAGQERIFVGGTISIDSATPSGDNGGGVAAEIEVTVNY